MKKIIISLWKELLVVFKFLCVTWTLFTLTSLTVLNVFQWIVVWWVGFFLFIYIPNKIAVFFRNIFIKYISANKKQKSLENNIDDHQSKPLSNYKSSKEDSVEKVLKMQKEFELKQIKKDYDSICQEIENNNNELIHKVRNTILDTYHSFGIEILVSGASLYTNQVVFKIVPHEGTRIKTILSFKDDLSLRLGTSIEMEVFSQLGFIGVIIPIDYFKIQSMQQLHQ